VDTLFVCSATAFMVLITGTYNVTGPDGAQVFTGLANISAGTGFTQAAMEQVLPGFGSMFVAVALFFFAFTTVIAYYYIAETNVAYLTRNLRSEALIFVLRVALIGSALYGCVRTSDLAWGLGDIGVGLMAWLNIFAILVLQKPALLALKDYEAQQAQGRLEPQFDPRALGIVNADLWVKIADRRKREG
jgi:AGCS family alanine or glycine:cation symporter